ncbi:MAG: CoA protein activase [Bacillota bacterium]
MGNFIEALELGADTLVMGGGIGPCRFGYYAQVQRDILKSLGYEFTMVVIEPPLGHAREVLAAARVLKGDNSWWTLARAIYLALVKLQACDEIHRAGLKLRPRVRDRARFGEIYRRSLRDIDEAASFAQVRKVTRAGLAEMHSLPQSDLHPPKVALVGEVYLLAEPAANLHIEERLGHLGVEVVRHVWISEWLKVNIFLDFLRLRRRESAEKIARPYLSCFVGGHGQHSVGETLKAAQEGMDGVIHVYPFTCTPEIVARGIMHKIAAQHRLPLVCFSMDEHSGEAGFQTRLEAFVDILAPSGRKVLSPHG